MLIIKDMNDRMQAKGIPEDEMIQKRQMRANEIAASREDGGVTPKGKGNQSLTIRKTY
jgi:hypothetical protein